MCKTFIILLRAGPQNDAWLKPVRRAKMVAAPASIDGRQQQLAFVGTYCITVQYCMSIQGKLRSIGYIA